MKLLDNKVFGGCVCVIAHQPNASFGGYSMHLVRDAAACFTSDPLVTYGSASSVKNGAIASLVPCNPLTTVSRICNVTFPQDTENLCRCRTAIALPFCKIRIRTPLSEHTQMDKCYPVVLHP